MTTAPAGDNRPLLLIDVDGVLNPFRMSRNKIDRTDYRRRTAICDGVSWRVWLNREHGRMILDVTSRLGITPVWCTTWEDHANTEIGPWVGLPELDVIRSGPLGFEDDQWKFGPVAEYAADRPLAWLDDDFPVYPDYMEWFMLRRGATPTLLHHVDADVGLEQSDLDAVAAWAATIGGAS